MWNSQRGAVNCPAGRRCRLPPEYLSLWEKKRGDRDGCWVSNASPHWKTHSSLFGFLRGGHESEGGAATLYVCVCVCKHALECVSNPQFSQVQGLRCFVRDEICGRPFVDGQTRLRFQSKYVEAVLWASVVSLDQYVMPICRRPATDALPPLACRVQNTILMYEPFDKGVKHTVGFLKCCLWSGQGVTSAQRSLHPIHSFIHSENSLKTIVKVRSKIGNDMP